MCVVKKSDTYLRRRADGGAQLEISSKVGFIDFGKGLQHTATVFSIAFQMVHPEEN